MSHEANHRGELVRPPSTAVVREVVRPTVAAFAKSSVQPLMTPIGLLKALRRRQSLAVGIAVCAAGLCGSAAWFLVPSAKFKTHARLQVMAQTPKVLFRTIETEGQGGEEYRRYQSTQRTLVKSQMVLNAALQNENVGRSRILRGEIDPITWLQQHLSVEYIAGSEIMEISLSGDDPAEIAGIVNAVKKAYMDEVVNVDLKRRFERHAMLKQYQEKYAKLLDEGRANLRRLAETVGSDDRQTLALRQQYAMEHLSQVQTERLEIQSQKRKLEAELRVLDLEGAASAPPPSSISEEEISRVIDEDPAIIRAAEELAAAEERLTVQGGRIQKLARKSADPFLRVLHQEVAARRADLAKKRKAIRPVVIRQFQGRSDHGSTGERTDVLREIAILDDLDRRLSDEIKNLSQGNHSLTVQTLDLQSIQDDTSQKEAAWIKIGTEIEALNIELQAPPRIRTIEDATVPVYRDDKSRYMTIVLAIFGPFFGSLFGVAFLELQSNRVDTADEVHAEVGVKVMGSLPLLPSRVIQGGLQPLDKDRYWFGVLHNSVDAARTMLLHAAQAESHRLVMVTSAVASEGKTSLSGYLATSLARSGLRTLLIDADLRNPSFHRVFDLPSAAGLSELLRNEADPDEVAVETALDNLSVVTAGKCNQQTIRALAQGGLEGCFARFKQRFDFIIVDSSPILLVPDGLIIAQQADAAVLSVFCNVSRKTSVKAATERLERLGVQILGAVVTSAHSGSHVGYYSADSRYSELPASAASSSGSDA